MNKIAELSKQDKPRRSGGQKSKIAYPYYDLDQSIEVAQAVRGKGGGHCTKDQLADFLGYSTVKSGAYLTRIAAAKQFGLVNIEKDQISITERANTILAPILPEDSKNARIAAFLNVPLFEAVYERFKGQQLPEPVGLKNLFQNHYHIVPDRVTPALRVLMESADQAGFFSVSGNRNKLIKPVGESSQRQKDDPKQEKPKDEPPHKPSGGGDGPPPSIHTAITGLLRELPKPGPWPKKGKERFMSAFRATIDFIYPDSDEDANND